MNAQKEAEYIAEIVALKAELKKEKMITCDGLMVDNGRLMLVASKCLNQIAANEGCRIDFEIHCGSIGSLFNYHISGVAMRAV